MRQEADALAPCPGGAGRNLVNVIRAGKMRMIGLQMRR